MTHSSFIAKYLNRYVEYNNDAFKFQCVDLMRQYIKEVVGVDPYAAVPGAANAKTIFQNFKDNSYYRKILNSPTNVPKQGDLVFWGYYPTVTTWAGHVAIFDKGDLYTIISFDQNYPTGRPCLLVKHGTSKLLHGYRGVMGWLRH